MDHNSNVVNMSPPKIVLPDKLDREFRKAVFETYGMKRGNLKLAAVEAIKDWIAKKKT